MASGVSGKGLCESLPRRLKRRGVKNARQLPTTTLPFMRVSDTVTRNEDTSKNANDCIEGSNTLQSPGRLCDLFQRKRSHLVDSSDSSLDDRLGLLVSQRVTRDGYSSEPTTFDLINIGRENLPAPGRLRSRTKEKKRVKKQTRVDIYKHIDQLKRKQAKFDGSSTTFASASNPLLDGDMTTNMDHFRGVPSSNSERDRGLYDENLSNIKLGSDTYGKNIFEKNMPPAHQSLYGDHSDINSTPSQQVPTNSPLLPRFLQQSSLAYSDSSAASSSVPTFYDQASLWMKTEDRVSMVESQHRGPLMDYTTNKTQDSCCHVRFDQPHSIMLSSGLDDSEGDLESHQSITHCGFARHEIED